MKSKKMKRIAVALASGALIATSVIPFQAAAASGGHEMRPAPVPQAIPDEAIQDDAEKLALPIVTEDVASWSHSVLTGFDDDPKFHTVEIDRQRTKVIVWWHGERTAELETAIAQPLSLSVEVRPTPYSPRQLQDAVDRVFSDESLSVTYSTIRPNGTGIDVAVAPSDARARSSQGSVSKIADVAGVPITVQEDTATSYGRSVDEWRVAGALKAGWNGSPPITNWCTTGFSIVKKNNPQEEGVLSAAHCGPVGLNWGYVASNIIYI